MQIGELFIATKIAIFSPCGADRVNRDRLSTLINFILFLYIISRALRIVFSVKVVISFNSLQVIPKGYVK